MTKDNRVFIKNLYFMLSYAFSVLREKNYEQIAAEKFEHVHDLLAAILARGVNHQLKQGLYREYIGKHDDLNVMRGKLNITGTMRNRFARKQRLACDYDELSENNLFNQILKTTALLLIRNEQVAEERRGDLKKAMLFFSDVDVLDPASIRWSSIRFQRNNQTYRMLISLCQFVLEGMLLTTEAGEFQLASFVDEQRMSRLYEKFILEYFSAEHPQLHTSASQIPWALDDGIGTMLPVMQSDITLQYKKRTLIIDAKYYTLRMTQTNYDVHTIHSGNLYQIFTYVKNKAAERSKPEHEVSGMLLYARTDEEIVPDCTYQMSGNRISVKTLDLNCEFSVLKKQLDDIALEMMA